MNRKRVREKVQGPVGFCAILMCELIDGQKYEIRFMFYILTDKNGKLDRNNNKKRRKETRTIKTKKGN